MISRFTKEEMNAAKTNLLSILIRHVGPNNKIGMGALFEQAFGVPFVNRINDTTPLRKIIRELRDEGQAICSSPSNTGGGYWLAASASELNDYCAREKKQVVRKLSRLATMQKVTLPQLLGQMQLEFKMEGDDA